MTLTKRQLADFLVLGGLTLLTTWYLFDAYSASPHILNLILILPVTCFVLLLCLIEFIGQFRLGGAIQSEEMAQGEGTLKNEEMTVDVLIVVLLFSAYVLSLPYLGFDVGTLIFIATYLFSQGERRLIWIVGYSVSFSMITALFFSKMLPYPMPMLLIATEF